MAGLVLTDASPLIGLSIVEGLGWLHTLFGEVWLPQQVQREVLTGQALRGEAEIKPALAAGWLRVWKRRVAEATLPDLGEGEAACIRIALSRDEPVLLLMDEKAGRAVAAEHGLRVAGTAAVIGMAKLRGLIPGARPVFEALHGSDFRISAEVIRTVLSRVGEA
ncbi:MAG: DUF3368 domain-containing protein [Betaproteobacteria bacterium]